MFVCTSVCLFQWMHACVWHILFTSTLNSYSFGSFLGFMVWCCFFHSIVFLTKCSSFFFSLSFVFTQKFYLFSVFQNHFRSAAELPWLVLFAVIFFFVLQMNIYLLHTFGCGFENTPKLSALPFEQTGFSFHRCTHCKMYPKRNMRKILIYILLLSLISFSLFSFGFFPFFHSNK